MGTGNIFTISNIGTVLMVVLLAILIVLEFWGKKLKVDMRVGCIVGMLFGLTGVITCGYGIMNAMKTSNTVHIAMGAVGIIFCLGMFIMGIKDFAKYSKKTDDGTIEEAEDVDNQEDDAEDSLNAVAYPLEETADEEEGIPEEASEDVSDDEAEAEAEINASTETEPGDDDHENVGSAAEDAASPEEGKDAENNDEVSDGDNENTLQCEEAAPETNENETVETAVENEPVESISQEDHDLEERQADDNNECDTQPEDTSSEPQTMKTHADTVKAEPESTVDVVMEPVLIEYPKRIVDDPESADTDDETSENEDTD